jgi:hypothetical protein
MVYEDKLEGCWSGRRPFYNVVLSLQWLGVTENQEYPNWEDPVTS